jgi:hypothetical protein
MKTEKLKGGRFSVTFDSEEELRRFKEEAQKLSVASLNPPKPEKGIELTIDEIKRMSIEELSKLLLFNLETSEEEWAGSPHAIPIIDASCAGFGLELSKEEEKKLEDDYQEHLRRKQTVYHHHVVGGNYPPRPGSLHSPTISEILYQANQPRPTTPYFQQTDQGPREVNPMDPHTDFSHDIPQTIDPRKPPYHNPTQGG